MMILKTPFLQLMKTTLKVGKLSFQKAFHMVQIMEKFCLILLWIIEMFFNINYHWNRWFLFKQYLSINKFYQKSFIIQNHLSIILCILNFLYFAARHTHKNRYCLVSKVVLLLLYRILYPTRIYFLNNECMKNFNHSKFLYSLLF